MSSVPCTKFVDGVYSSVKSQEYIDWLVSTGMPAAECQKMLNTTWRTTIKTIPTGYFGSFTCDEFPEYNTHEVYLLGVEQTVDSVMFCGKAKVLFTITGDNHFECKADTENMGNMKWTEDYTEAGLTVNLESNGKPIKDFWKREGALPTTCFIEGSYTCVKDKKMGEFMARTGAPEAEIKKMVGSTWHMTIKKVPGGYHCRYGCKTIPEWSGSDTFLFGVDNVVDSVLFGGKARISFSESTRNHIDACADTDNMGKISWTEDYTVEGYHVNYEVGGNTVREFWRREESMEGFYELDRVENAEAFLKATGTDPSLAAGFEGMSSGLKKVEGGRYTITERIAGKEAKHTFKLDEEFDYDFPEYPDMKAKVVTTRVDGQTLRMIVKKDNGRMEDWTYKVCPMGALWTGTDKTSGVTMKMYMKKSINFYGRAKMVAAVGMEPVLQAFGLSADAAKSLASEMVTISLTPNADGSVQFTSDSKLQPMNMSFKWDEEYEVSSPMFDAPFKNVSTIDGNKMTTISKNPRGTVKMEYTHGDTFCVGTNTFVEQGLSYKVIMEKIE